MLDIAEKSSRFLGAMKDRANLLPVADITFKHFANEAMWRNAWANRKTYTKYDTPADLSITDPFSFLQHLDQAERRQCLIEYLKEFMPVSAVDTNTHFKIITDNSILFESSEMIEAAKAMMQIGDGMHNIVTVVDKNALEAAKKELQAMYLSRSSVSENAHQDFSRYLRSHPKVMEELNTDPVLMATLTKNDQDPLPAALRHKIFTKDNLKIMVDRFKEDEIKRTMEKSKAKVVINAFKNRMEVRDQRNMHEKIWDNMSKMSTGQWLLTVGSVGAYLYWLFKKRDKADITTNVKWQRRIVGTSLIAGVFYGGARAALKGTGLDAAFKIPELGANIARESGTWLARGRDGMPNFSDKEISAFAHFVDRVAQDEFDGQIEAMSYISTIPVETIANAFTLSSDARGGTLAVRNSDLSKKIDEIYGATGQAGKVRSALSRPGTGDTIAHLFYMIAALENSSEHAKVEEARGNKPHDDIPDGSIRDIYIRMAEKGQNLAVGEYLGQNWYDIVGSFVNRPDVLRSRKIYAIKSFEHGGKQWNLDISEEGDQVVVLIENWRGVNYYPHRFTADDFDASTPEAIVDAWLEGALTQKQTECGPVPNLTKNGKQVTLDDKTGNAKFVGTSSAYRLLWEDADDIKTKYSTWCAAGGTAHGLDPLK